ncbi:hypothetical protein C5167_005735 [Papaver somniferum]|uniref:Uncharacterized protein n=1 Tax=Papaver somniferum TaxID=3469 RepID=A0A4Y7JET5_PAPSO|nr:hypothetical protein C5167_005735 [Papaver somniferum]
MFFTSAGLSCKAVFVILPKQIQIDGVPLPKKCSCDLLKEERNKVLLHRPFSFKIRDASKIGNQVLILRGTQDVLNCLKYCLLEYTMTKRLALPAKLRLLRTIAARNHVRAITYQPVPKSIRYFHKIPFRVVFSIMHYFYCVNFFLLISLIFPRADTHLLSTRTIDPDFRHTCNPKVIL